MPEPLDRYEKRILALLQQDASLSTAAIAEKVGLSSSPCWRRIDRLEREGFIKRKVALVDRRKIGLNAQIFAQIKLNAHGRANLDEFTAAIRAFPEVLECYVLMGSVDFLIRVVATALASPTAQRMRNAVIGGVVLSLPLWIAPFLMPLEPWWQQPALNGGRDPRYPSAASEPVLAAQADILD